VVNSVIIPNCLIGFGNGPTLVNPVGDAASRRGAVVLASGTADPKRSLLQRIIRGITLNSSRPFGPIFRLRTGRPISTRSSDVATGPGGGISCGHFL
jgi:hypothetical protein